MPGLLVISSAPATVVDGRPFLDRKFVEGMRLYARLWDGPVGCLLKERASPFPFGRTFAPDELPFELRLIPETRRVEAPDLAGADLVLCGGDSHEYLHLADARGPGGPKLVYIIEYVPETRRQIVMLDRDRSLPRKLYALLWAARQERRRRRAFARADGLQANGYPARDTYAALNSNTLMYIDNRIGADLLATAAEMASRRARVLSGAPLRLIHSGRLEPMKGAQDLVPLARRLAERGLLFTLDIFGTGSLADEIRAGIAGQGLAGSVRLHGEVDFATELVPFARTRADLYLSCHRQSDPSCTYVESMGCGLAVAGYANRMWAALRQASGAGWQAPIGRVPALADAVLAAAADRADLARACDAGRDFAAAHLFEDEFRRRIDHLTATRGRPGALRPAGANAPCR